MNEENTILKMWKGLKIEERFIDSTLNFCEYYGIKTDANNISLDDKTLTKNDMSLDEYYILVHNLDIFIKFVFLKHFITIEEIDNIMKHKIANNINEENVVTVCMKFIYRTLTYKEMKQWGN